jgi:hypothetical protein
MGFDCHKVGHVPITELAMDVYILDGYPHVGAICKKCKCTYMVQVSDAKMEVSTLVDAKGGKVVKES